MTTSLGKTLQILRAAKGLSQHELANSCKISVPHLSLIESDRRRPSMHVIEKLSEQLGVPIVFLVRRSMNESHQGALGPEKATERRLSQAIKQLHQIEQRLRQLVAQERDESVQKSPNR